MLTAKIKPVQLIVISMEENDKIIIFLYDLNMNIKSLILPIEVIIINKKIKDQKPLWKAISTAGTNFILLKNSGWGIPQKIVAKKV